MGLHYLCKIDIFLTPKAESSKTILIITTVPPGGKFNVKEITMQLITDKKEKIKEEIIGILKLMESFGAVSGRIISIAETSMLQATFIFVDLSKNIQSIFSLVI